MRTSPIAFGEREAKALDSWLSREIVDLPTSHEDEVSEAIKKRLIWEEMYEAGLLTTAQRLKMSNDIGPTLGHLLAKELHGQELRSVFVRLLYVPGEGKKTATKIGNFLRVRYGIAVGDLPIGQLTAAKSASPSLSATDVREVDTGLADILAMSLDQDELNLPESILENLSKAGLATVGDVLVSPKADLARRTGLTAREIDNVRNQAAGIAKVDISKLRGPMLEIVRWKNAVMKATG